MPNNNKRNQKQSKKNHRPKSRPNRTTKDSWANALVNPLTASPAHIPDSITTDSALEASIDTRALTLVASGGTSQTHNGGMIMYPHPLYGSSSIQETTAGGANLIDGADATNSGRVKVPNCNALTGGSTAPFGAKVRCAGMGFSCSYLGTEILRSASVTIGVAPISRCPKVFAAIGTYDMALSAIGNGTDTGISLADLKQAMVEKQTFRVPASGQFFGIWKPNGTPTYQILNQAQALPTIRAAGVDPSADVVGSSGLYAPPGTAGLQSGQNVLICLIENDTSNTAVAGGSTYNFEMRWLWEVIPDQPEAITADLTPSPANAVAVDHALNAISKQPIAGWSASGLTRSGFH